LIGVRRLTAPSGGASGGSGRWEWNSEEEVRSESNHLSGVGRKLSSQERIALLHNLAKLEIDQQVTESEANYFDMVANALKATPSEIAGLGQSRR
jgi:uncharacterized tellurite resistance protein B-like protein